MQVATQPSVYQETVLTIRADRFGCSPEKMPLPLVAALMELQIDIIKITDPQDSFDSRDVQSRCQCPSIGYL